jgi:hypothetical protein
VEKEEDEDASAALAARGSTVQPQSASSWMVAGLAVQCVNQRCWRSMIP